MARRTCEVYRDHEGKWRWRLRATNGNIVGDSGQGYVRKGNAVRMAGKTNPTAKLVELAET